MPPRAIALLPALVLLAGCGNARTPVPNLAVPAPSGGFRTVVYPVAGVSLQVPRNWVMTRQRGALLSTTSSGQAVIAVWRHPRTTPPPGDAAALARAEQALVAAARARDPGLTVIRWDPVHVAGAAALQLSSFEQIGGHRRRVRSVHVYVPGTEIVLEEYAPVPIFHVIDHYVFSPVRRSLRLLTRRAA